MAVYPWTELLIDLCESRMYQLGIGDTGCCRSDAVRLRNVTGPYFGLVVVKSVGYLPMAKPAALTTWGSVATWLTS
jgi:hypothetical protein